MVQSVEYFNVIINTFPVPQSYWEFGHSVAPEAAHQRDLDSCGKEALLRLHLERDFVPVTESVRPLVKFGRRGNDP